MAIELNDNVFIRAGKPIDYKFGPYLSINDANENISIPERYNGLMFGVYENPSDIINSDVKTYYYKGNLTNNDVKLFVNYVHPAYTPYDLVLTGATVFNSIVTDNIGSVSSITLRQLSNEDINAIPYTNSTKNSDLGLYGITSQYYKFNTNPINTPQDKGTMYWDINDDVINVILNNSIQKIGEHSFYPVRNQTGVLIPKGTGVRFSGTVIDSTKLLIEPFIANGSVSSSLFLGLTMEDIDNNADGKVTWFGRLDNINTNSFNQNDQLYASTTIPGGFQITIPQAPNNIILIGTVIKKSTNQGIIFVRPQLGYNINNDEGIKITNITNNDLLIYQSTTGLWINKSAQSIVLGHPLTGYILGSNTSILETDTVLQAFNKIQGQINARVTEETVTQAEIAAALSASNALASEQAAAISASNALASQQSATLSESNALASELAAASSESVALEQAGIATQKASDALSSQQAALASEQAAALSESNALASEQAAELSASNALASELAAEEAKNQTELDRIATGEDRTQTELDRIATGQDAETTSQNVLTTEGYKDDAESAAYLATEQAILSAAARDDAEAFKIASQQAAGNALVSEQNALSSEQTALSSANLSTAQAILSSAARDGAESERIICEDIRDELQPYLREIRFDAVGTTSYYGKASKGSLETDQVWTITRIIDNDGVPTTSILNNVAWSDKLILNYL
jgi:hypothetical protein